MYSIFQVAKSTYRIQGKTPVYDEEFRLSYVYSFLFEQNCTTHYYIYYLFKQILYCISMYKKLTYLDYHNGRHGYISDYYYYQTINFVVDFSCECCIKSTTKDIVWKSVNETIYRIRRYFETTIFIITKKKYFKLKTTWMKNRITFN